LMSHQKEKTLVNSETRNVNCKFTASNFLNVGRPTGQVRGERKYKRCGMHGDQRRPKSIEKGMCARWNRDG